MKQILFLKQKSLRELYKKISQPYWNFVSADKNNCSKLIKKTKMAEPLFFYNTEKPVAFLKTQ